MIPVWPASLPQRVLAEGFNEGLREGRLQTPPERGAPKLRRGSSAVGKPILQSIKIDAEQFTILERFWEKDTGGGALPFWFPDQTRGGIPILTTAGEPILTPYGAALLNAKWWLVQFGGTAPSAGTRSRGMSYVVPVPMTVLYSWAA
ncbi:hypothetical protein [Methylobacterium sp. CM6244]